MMIIYIVKDYKLKKKISLKFIIIISSILLIYSLFIMLLGIYIANSEYFNDNFYIKSRQMQTLMPKEVWLKQKQLQNSKYMCDLNIISDELYESYHNYYLKVIIRIKEDDWLDKTEKKEFLEYLSGYEKRKEQMIKHLFPMKNITGEYGTMLNYLYPKMLTEFDRTELITYKFMLEHSYNSFDQETIQYIFME